jgi:uncharacterized protein YdaT
MTEFISNIDFLGAEKLGLDTDVVYKVRVNITAAFLRSAEVQHLEALVCEVFVQEAECRSSESDDLKRCAVRRIESIAKQAHLKVSAETLGDDAR